MQIVIHMFLSQLFYIFMIMHTARTVKPVLATTRIERPPISSVRDKIPQTTAIEKHLEPTCLQRPPA